MLICASPAQADQYADGVKLYDQGRYKEAAEDFEATLAYNRQNSNAMYYAALCYQRQGNTIKATNYYKAILQRFPGSVAATQAERALRSGVVDASRPNSQGAKVTVSVSGEDGLSDD